MAIERDKIKGAIRTDFVLSAEIIVIVLGTVAEATFGRQVLVLLAIAALMTVGVYGLVVGIVKLDDAGLHLTRRAGMGPGARLQRRIGGLLVLAAPWLMKFLSVAGTVAMFMVGGGILTHGVPVLHEQIAHWAAAAGNLSGLGGVMEAIVASLLDVLAGIIAGAAVLAAVLGAQRIFKSGNS